ncbi:MAG: hypothetical protein AB7N71_00925 [Phycisphaerae bacterium]
MSTIPPNSIASILQSHAGSQQADRTKQATDQARAEASQPRDSVSLSIESTDTDKTVSADAEGMGSQGRPEDEGEEAREKSDTADADFGMPEDSPRLDITG